MYYKILVDNWDEIKSISKASYNFVFRGHSHSNWKLKSTLERAADRSLLEYYLIHFHEHQIIREFKSVAKQYLNQIPENNNNIEWLSILQHYGAPTRLLDFTYSMYIASFFAFESATGDSAIWAINTNKLNSQINKKMKLDPNYGIWNFVLEDYQNLIANKLLSHENESLIIDANQNIFDSKENIFSVRPTNRNQRQSIQHSVFLLPSKSDNSFENILVNQFNLGFDSLDDKNAKTITTKKLIESNFNNDTSIIKFIIPREVCLDGLFDLRNMNITAATLFPGLDGQARSLNLIMRNMEGVNLKISKQRSKKSK